MSEYGQKEKQVGKRNPQLLRTFKQTGKYNLIRLGRGETYIVKIKKNIYKVVMSKRKIMEQEYSLFVALLKPDA